MSISEIGTIRGEVQGNILDAYRLPCVRHIVMRVEDADQARAVMAAMLDPSRQGPTITSGSAGAESRRSSCLNLGITYLGLRALGVPAASLKTFPPEYREGMVARAARLGDVGASRPEDWVASFRRPDSAHLVFTVHAPTAVSTAAAAADVLAAGRGSLAEVGHFDGEALVRDSSGGCGLSSEFPDGSGGEDRPKRIEHFGFRDGLSQPHFQGVDHRCRPTVGNPTEPLGVVLLGHPTTSPVSLPVPKPHALGHQGSFSAFRVLAQDVAGFRRFVTETTRGLQARERAAGAGPWMDEELLKAKMCGRWPNGLPLALAATSREAAEKAGAPKCDLNSFDFSGDQDGRTCPVGAHIRRVNPRNAHIVQRPSNRARRLVRRGVPFGPWLPEGEEPRHGRERGLLGSFLCASLSAQFETMQYEWINLGLQDPRITSTNDPLTGRNEESTSSFTFFDGRDWHTVPRLSAFVETMGGAYCFHPSMKAIEWIASAGCSDRVRP